MASTTTAAVESPASAAAEAAGSPATAKAAGSAAAIAGRRLVAALGGGLIALGGRLGSLSGALIGLPALEALPAWGSLGAPDAGLCGAAPERVRIPGLAEPLPTP